MKRLFFTLLIVSGATALFAQEPATPAGTTQKPKQSQPTVTHTVAVKNYCCPGCDYVSTKPGTCPHHSKALIRDGMYYCTDGTTSKEPGACADGSAMIKMVDKTKKAKETKEPKETKDVKTTEPAK